MSLLAKSLKANLSVPLLAEVIEKEVGSLSAEQVAALESGEKKGEDDKAIPRIYDLAYHYDAAGERRKAWMHALIAAEQARRQSALEVAANNYVLAKRNADQISNTVRYRIALGYGETLMLLGRHEDANEQLGGVIDLVNAAEKKAHVESIQGEIAQQQGLLETSRSLCELVVQRNETGLTTPAPFCYLPGR